MYPTRCAAPSVVATHLCLESGATEGPVSLMKQVPNTGGVCGVVRVVRCGVWMCCGVWCGVCLCVCVCLRVVCVCCVLWHHTGTIT